MEHAFPSTIAARATGQLTILAVHAAGLASLAADARPALDDGAAREPLEAAAEVEDEELKK